MEQCPLEKLIVAKLVKKFPTFFWNLKLHYLILKNLPLVCDLSQVQPVHTFPSCLVNNNESDLCFIILCLVSVTEDIPQMP